MQSISLHDFLDVCQNKLTSLPSPFRVLYCLVAIGLIVFLIVDVGSDLQRLTSAAGMLIFILIGFITSTNPSRVGKTHLRGALGHI